LACTTWQSLAGDFGKYIELINTTIDFERDGHDVCIKPSFDEELQGAIRHSSSPSVNVTPTRCFLHASSLTLSADNECVLVMDNVV
jgi:hypothetical protein